MAHQRAVPVSKQETCCKGCSHLVRSYCLAPSAQSGGCHLANQAEITQIHGLNIRVRVSVESRPFAIECRVSASQVTPSPPPPLLPLPPFQPSVLTSAKTRSAPHLPLILQLPISCHVRHPELSVVPGHRGVVPADPSHSPSISTQPWCRVKVPPPRQDLHLARCQV